MRRHRALQPAAPSAQQSERDLDLSSDRQYLLSIDAARLLCFDRRHDGTERTPEEAMRLFREWAARNRVPELRRGRTLLYERRVLAAFLEQRRWTHARSLRAVRPSAKGQFT